jgi:hypothetical protein
MYYNIKIYRFYIKCTQCSAEITFKTDPKNTDYVAEHGAQRNFELWRSDGTEELAEETAEERLERIEKELAEDPMAELEAKQVDSKREMDILDALQEIRTRNARLERADTDSALDRITARDDVEGLDIPLGSTEADLQRMLEAEEDEEEVRRVFGRLKSGAPPLPAMPPVKAMPNIELDEPIDEDEEALEGAHEGPVASGSGSTPADALREDGAMPPPPPPVVKVPTVKRKLQEIEPDALSLLSEDARKFASSVSFGGTSAKGKGPAALSGIVAPPKKKLNAGSKFGIAPKAKPKAA